MQRERGVSRNCCVAGHGHSSFGAKGNGQADDTGAIQKAIGAAKESGSKLYFPKGDYQITQTIQINAHGLQMEGAGPDHTRIIAGAEMDRMCYLLGSNVVISHMSFDGNNTAKYGVHPFHLNGPGSKLAFLSVYRARSHGFFLDHSQLLEVTHCTSEHNGGDGFYVTDCNASVIRSCRARGNEGRGLTITSTDYSGGCTVLVGTVSDARGSIKSTSITIARNCVIKNNWLAREQAESPPPRIHVDANLTNPIGKNYSPWNAELIPVIEE